MMYRLTTLIVMTLALGLLGACSPAPAQDGTPQAETPAPSPTPVEFPSMLTQVISFLNQEYGIQPADIQIVEIEEMQWPDSCLGAAQPGEMCLQVITPGFRAVLDTPQGRFVFHTDESGESFRLASGPSGIQGRAMIGPTCPGGQQNTECPDQPYQTEIAILDQAGEVVARVQTDAEGYFTVHLQPGTYTLMPESTEPFPVAPKQVIAVEEGQFTQVQIEYDSGIR